MINQFYISVIISQGLLANCQSGCMCSTGTEFEFTDELTDESLNYLYLAEMSDGSKCYCSDGWYYVEN